MLFLKRVGGWLSSHMTLWRWHSRSTTEMILRNRKLAIKQSIWDRLYKSICSYWKEQKSVASTCDQNSRQYLKNDLDHRCGRNARCRKWQRKGHFSVVCWTKGTQEEHAEPFFSGSIACVAKCDESWKAGFLLHGKHRSFKTGLVFLLSELVYNYLQHQSKLK